MKETPMKPQSIIQAHTRHAIPPDARISAIEGRRYVRKPTYLKNKETGDEYYAIVGAIAFPAGPNSLVSPFGKRA